MEAFWEVPQGGRRRQILLPCAGRRELTLPRSPSSRAPCWPLRAPPLRRSGRDPPELLAGVDIGAQMRLVHCLRL